jgi:hypothetical protein
MPQSACLPRQPGDGSRLHLHAAGEHGRFELAGIDRVRVRGGHVAENVIVFATAACQARARRPIPWI